jgi:hypothetical protein
MERKTPGRMAGAGVRRAGARRRTAKTGRWLRPIRLGIGASNCATRSAPSSNSCAAPSRSCARNSIRRTRRSEAADSAIRTQARHSASSPKRGLGAAVASGRRCENVSCCRSQRTEVEARDQPGKSPGESASVRPGRTRRGFTDFAQQPHAGAMPESGDHRTHSNCRDRPPPLTRRPQYSSWRRIQVWKASPSSRPFGARSRIG